jgi:transcriptional regulator with XRE-family HTH domain
MKLIFKQVSKIDSQKTGQLAREMREKKKISLRKVARRMGVSAAFLSDLELGRRSWNEENAGKFTRALK